MSSSVENPTPTTVVCVQSETIASGAQIAAKTICGAVSDLRDFQSTFFAIGRNPARFDAFWSAIRHRFEFKFFGWGLTETATPSASLHQLQSYLADIFHLHNIYDSGIRVEDVGRLSQERPIVWTIHDGRWVCWRNTLGDGFSSLVKRIGWEVFRARLKKATRNVEIVFPSDWLRNEAIQQRIFGEKRMHVIPTPVSLEFFKGGRSRESVRKAYGFSSGTPLILFVAWQAWKTSGDLNKGYDILEEAIPRLRRLHHFQFVILGHQGEKIPAHMGATWVPPDGTSAQVADLMKAADFVLGASRQEGLGNVIQEAHAVGTPALVSRSTGYLEIVDDGITGLHFEKGNSTDLIRKASKLISSPEEIEAMGINAAEKALRFWHPTTVALRYQEVYARALLREG